MLSADDLRGLSRRDLRGILDRGHPVTPDDVAGFAFRGVSVGLPRIIERLTWTTFQKAFVREGQRVRGYNVRVEQRGTHSATVPKLRHGVPVTFGHFEVVPKDRGIVLDYGAYAGRFDPLVLVRDPVVALNEGSTDLLLGWSYLDLGFVHAPTPSFFTLERESAVV